MSRGTSEYGSTCTCESAHINEALLFSTLGRWSSYMVSMNLECSSIYILGYGQNTKYKKKKVLEMKINSKHRKIQHSIAPCRWAIYSIFSVMLVVSMWHTTICSAGVWKLGRGRWSRSSPLPVSYIQYHKTLSHCKRPHPSVSGPLFTV